MNITFYLTKTETKEDRQRILNAVYNKFNFQDTVNTINDCIRNKEEQLISRNNKSL